MYCIWIPQFAPRRVLVYWCGPWGWNILVACCKSLAEIIWPTAELPALVDQAPTVVIRVMYLNVHTYLHVPEESSVRVQVGYRYCDGCNNQDFPAYHISTPFSSIYASLDCNNDVKPMQLALRYLNRLGPTMATANHSKP
jgi:hypothetical protein